MFAQKSPSDSAISAKKPPTPVQHSPVPNLNVNPVEVEHLKEQLKSSEMTISELKTIVEKLAMENSALKTRIDSQIISPEMQL